MPCVLSRTVAAPPFVVRSFSYAGRTCAASKVRLDVFGYGRDLSTTVDVPGALPFTGRADFDVPVVSRYVNFHSSWIGVSNLTITLHGLTFFQQWPIRLV